MGNQLFKNNAAGTLNGTIAIGGTTLNLGSGQGSKFPTPTGGDYFLVTLYEKNAGGAEINYEVVSCTSRTADALTITRDFEGLVVAAGGTSGGWGYPAAVGINPSQVVYAEMRETAYLFGNAVYKDSKDQSGGVPGLTLFKLNLRNALNTITSWFTTAATVARTWTMPDKDGTVAMLSDITGTNSGINTGDQTTITGNAGTATLLQTARTIDGQSFSGGANITVIAPGTHAAGSKATPIDADEIPLVDTASSNVLAKLTWLNLKATLKTYLDTLYVTLAAVNLFTKAQRGAYVPLTDAATIAIDLSLGNQYTVVLGGNRTFGVPTNIGNAGQQGIINVWQDATGSRIPAFAWIYGWGGGTVGTFSAAGCTKDMMPYSVDYYATGTFTVTIASPGVFTLNGHGFISGQKCQATTTGALPTGLTPSTTYYVHVIDANTFHLCTSVANVAAGTYIATSGSQSGVHTIVCASITLALNPATP